MWIHSDRKDDNVSLHDCRATRVSIDNRDLIFNFSDGFWIAPGTKSNQGDVAYKTDESQLKLCGYDIADIYVFRELRFFRRLIRTYRVSLSLDELVENINSGKWELEFIYEYHTYRGVLFTCWIWSKRKPYHRECQLVIDCDAMECFWNELRKDCPW